MDIIRTYPSVGFVGKIDVVHRIIEAGGIGSTPDVMRDISNSLHNTPTTLDNSDIQNLIDKLKQNNVTFILTEETSTLPLQDNEFEQYANEITSALKTSEWKNESDKRDIEREDTRIRRTRKSRLKLAERHGCKTHDEYIEKRNRKSTMQGNKDCALFLGCHIAERILSHIFKRVKQLPYNHPGYDFVCGKGFKVDVKASCVTDQRFQFTINRNKQPDYFLLIAFDNRNDLTPLGVWLVKSDEVIRGRKLNEFHTLGVLNRSDKLRILKKYEQTEKLECVLECCDNLKTKKQCNIIK